MADKPRECRARVAVVRALGPDILEVDLAMEEPPALAFAAGQWVSVPFGPKTVRAYTIASTPQSPARITLCADVAPGGIGSQWFRGLRPGVEVQFKAPFGGFVFSRADPRHPLFVAEAIGIVPIRAMLAELYATGFGRPALLIYGARHPGVLAYHAEFLSLQRRYPAFAYHPVVADMLAGWAGRDGDLVDAVAELAPAHLMAPAPDELVAYVAGGAATIARVRDLLLGHGLVRKAVRWEKFW